MRSRVLRLLIFVVAVVVSLAILETGLRLSGRFPVPPERLETFRPDLYQEYKPYGYRLWPSRNVTYLYPKQNPRPLALRSNRHGFRGRALDQPDSRRRIIVLGDSMVFGDGVEEPERFTEQLEAETPAWRVDNLGMSGFGPDLMLRALEEVGLPLKPDVVIVTMYTDDFRRVHPRYAGAGFEIPRFAIRSGRLVSVPYPRSSVWTRWSIATAIHETLWRLSGAEWDLNTAILDRFREDGARSRFTLVLTFLPGRWDTPNDQQRRNWLRMYAERTATPFLDLTDSILDGTSESRFIFNNPHLNASGHAVVAREIQKLLRDRLPAGQRPSAQTTREDEQTKADQMKRHNGAGKSL